MRQSITQLGLRTEPENGKYIPGSYLIRRYKKGTRLLELVLVEKSTYTHVGTIDLLDVVFVAGKKRLKDLSKYELYEILQRIFSIKFFNSIFVTPDAEVVITQLFSHNVKQPYIARKNKVKEIL
jgi:hypothetical protein